MKIETKFKIINWVKRILRYEETNLPGPFIEKKSYDLETITHTHIYSKEEWEYVCQNELIKIQVAGAMLKVLSSNEVNAIDTKFEPLHSDQIKLTAKLIYVKQK